MNISKHITYEESIRSETALKMGIKNIPNKDIIESMKITANKIFEPVREFLGKPIKVNSFYRSPELNKAIGGSGTSQHCLGEAIDLDTDNDNKKIFEFIMDNLDFDQLIIEGISKGKMAWVHCSYKSDGNRKQILFMYKQNGKTIYQNYSAKRYSELIY